MYIPRPGLIKLTRIGSKSRARFLIMPCRPVAKLATTVQSFIGLLLTAPVVNVILDFGPGFMFDFACFAMSNGA